MNFRIILGSYKNSALECCAWGSAESLNQFGENRYLYFTDFFLFTNTYFFKIYFSKCHFKNEILFMFSQVYFQLVDFFVIINIHFCVLAINRGVYQRDFLPYFITVISVLLFLPLIGCEFFLDFSKSYHKQIVLLFLFSKAIISIFY